MARGQAMRDGDVRSAKIEPFFLFFPLLSFLFPPLFSFSFPFFSELKQAPPSMKILPLGAGEARWTSAKTSAQARPGCDLLVQVEAATGQLGAESNGSCERALWGLWASAQAGPGHQLLQLQRHGSAGWVSCTPPRALLRKRGVTGSRAGMAIEPERAAAAWRALRNTIIAVSWEPCP